MDPLIVADRLDWPEFADRFWDKRPVLIRSVDPAPFVESEVFRTAVRACDRLQATLLPANVQLTVERTHRRAPDGLLPRHVDRTFDGYEARLAGRLDGLRYALVISAFHPFSYPLWRRERSFLAGLWEQVGIPLTGAITTLFHGTYENSPVGVHKDRFATFMYGLKGRKRIRFWPSRPWEDQATTKPEYEAHLPGSFTVEVGPADLLYWPAGYYHVGENCGTDAATSVNIGIPREEHHTRYELTPLLTNLEPETLVGAGPLPTLLPPLFAPLFVPAPGADGLLEPALPPVLQEALRQLRTYGSQETDERVARLSLRFWTAGGLEPVPAPAPPRPLGDEVIVRGDPRFPVRWTDRGTAGSMCAVNGHVFTTTTPVACLLGVIEPLNTGTSVAVGALLKDPRCAPADPEGIRALLQRLESFRGITRVSREGAPWS